MSITARFGCGHEIALTGNERKPRCECGNDVLVSVNAPAPKFRGHAIGPCAQFVDLPAKAITLKADKE